MRLLVFSDVHGDIEALERLVEAEADYYIAAGDLVSWARGLDHCGKILQRRGSRTWVLPGNHESEGQVERFCERWGLSALHGKSFQAEGWHIAGLGYSNRTPFNTPGEYTEKEIADRLAPFSGLNPLVLVCHCPPWNTPLDRIHEGLHAGSRAVREFIEQVQPAHFLCGHIHEAEGVAVDIGPVRCVNVGKRGFLLELAPPSAG